jgi:hypothetical protein
MAIFILLFLVALYALPLFSQNTEHSSAVIAVRISNVLYQPWQGVGSCLVKGPWREITL